MDTFLFAYYDGESAGLAFHCFSWQPVESDATTFEFSFCGHEQEGDSCNQLDSHAVLLHLLLSSPAVLIAINCKMTRKSLPNILIAGTPGTGKSSLVKKLMSNADISSKMKHIDISQYAKENSLCSEEDIELNSSVLDEDALLDHLESNIEEIENGGIIFDYHAGDLIPEDWVDRIYILQTETNYLYDRLKERQYNEKKITNNIEAEIFQVILNEAQEMNADIVHSLPSNTEDDLKANAQQISEFITSWSPSNK